MGEIMLRVANPNPNVSKPNSGRERKKDLNNSFKNTRKPTLTPYSNSIQFKITSLRKKPAQKHGYHYSHPQNTTNVSALQTLKTDFHANLFFSFRAANEKSLRILLRRKRRCGRKGKQNPNSHGFSSLDVRCMLV